MTLKKTFLVIAILIGLLLPAADLLQNQNPWNCFAFTMDESFFAQATSNWIDGKGYRMANTGAFDPSITVGIPMAWGTNIVRALTSESISNSGRIFTYLCFIGLLLTLALTAYRRDRNWLAAPLAVGIFAYGISKISLGGYLTFGFLGEMAGFLSAAFAYRALDEKNPLQAGAFSVLTFVMKPTFLFFLPAVGIATALHSRKAGFRAIGTQVLLLGTMYFLIANARSESILHYLEFFLQQSREIAHFVPPGTLIDYYEKIGLVPTFLSAAFIVTGGWAALRARRSDPATVAAFFIFAIAFAYFLLIGHRPVEKQWSAVFGLTLVGFAAPWASQTAGWFQGWIPKENLRALLIAIVAVWILAIGKVTLHAYRHKPETECPSKELSVINEKLRALADSGFVTRENLGAVIKFYPYTMSIYRLGWDPVYESSWSTLKGKNPEWIFAETSNLPPLPAECTSDFQGSTFSLVHCKRR